MLGRDWERAQATIVAVNFELTGFSPSGSRAEFVGDVQPDSGAPAFRATFKGPRHGINFEVPEVGQVIPVRFLAKSGEVKIDTSDPAVRRDTELERQKEQFDAIARLAPDSPPPAPEPSQTVEAPPPAEPTVQAALGEVSAAVAGVSGASSEIAETLAAIKRAKASGNQDEVDRLKAEFALRSAEKAQAAAGRPAPPPDSLARLQTLADLRDRGALTDAEFAAEKAKILDAS
jgi:hypothetical protein